MVSEAIKIWISELHMWIAIIDFILYFKMGDFLDVQSSRMRESKIKTLYTFRRDVCYFFLGML